MIIDAYTHLHSDEYLELMKTFRSEQATYMVSLLTGLSRKHPQFTSLEHRIGDMDKYGIDQQVTMIQPIIEPNMFVSGDALLKACRTVNDELAQAAEKSNGRIVSLGVAPLNSEEYTREEMRRALRDLGLKGFMVNSNVQGKPIDKFSAFWDEAGKLGTVVYVHPADAVSSAGRPYEDEFDLSHVMGWPFESTLALCRIVFTGVLDKNPGVKIVAHHLGGMIPFFAGRIAESYDKRASPPKPDQQEKISSQRPIMETFKEIYYDTAVGGSLAALRCGYEVFGAKKLIFSTDYPWGPEGGRIRLGTYANNVKELGLSPEEEEQILSGNVKSLLGI